MKVSEPVPEVPSISRQQRQELNGHRSCILWFTGLPASGKSTITKLLEARLFSQKVRTVILDGDQIRQGLNRDLGFSKEDRRENIRRISEVAKILKEAGLIVLVAAISPFQEDRTLAKQICEDDYYEIYVNCSLEECIKRDPKGLYRKAQKGEITNFTGISSPYEVPINPHLVLDSEHRTAEQLIDELIVFMHKEKILSV